MRLAAPLLALACALAAAACHDGEAPALRAEARLPGQAVPATETPLLAGAGSVPAPLALDGTAYEAGARRELPATEPQELHGLHHVFQLSDSIWSGAEPDSEAAYAQLQQMGVKTVLSVDGKVPDAAVAARYGLRYVHVPIQYKGMSEEQLLQIGKTFRELDGPFYVHCFHGVHRGPAAAAVGRVLLDGADREQGLAEMRQWCGTSAKYEGLYGLVASGELPDAAATAAYEWDFPAATPLDGVAGLMVEITRPFDRLEDFKIRGWQVNPDHPDLDPVNEAAILAGLLDRVHELDTLADDAAVAAEFRERFAAMREHGHVLERTFRDARAAGTPEAWGAAGEAFDALDADCTSCHRAHRNR